MKGLRVEERGAIVALFCDGVFAEINLLELLEGGELLEGVKRLDVVSDADDLGESSNGGETGEAAVAEST